MAMRDRKQSLIITIYGYEGQEIAIDNIITEENQEQKPNNLRINKNISEYMYVYKHDS